jgi:hypothetical protein
VAEGTGVIISQPVNSHANIRSVSTLRLSSLYNGLRTSCRWRTRVERVADTDERLTEEYRRTKRFRHLGQGS